MWQWRSLTPIGKIQIVNSITNSYFMYKLQVLPTPTQKMIIQYKKAITRFIWDEKKPKISYGRLIAACSKGGLQLRDLSLINESLKLAKIQTMLENTTSSKPIFWVQALRNTMQVNHCYLFGCNMKGKDIVKVMPNSLLKEMLYIWSKHNWYSNPTHVNEILNQKIWYNSHIRKEGKWLFDVGMYDSGILKVIDLFDLDTGNFYDYNQFCEMFPQSNINYVQYYGIIASIPRQWKQILVSNEPSPPDMDSWFDEFEKLCAKGKPSRILYNYLRDVHAVDNSNLLILWNNDLRLKLTQKQFDKLFVQIKQITTSTKLRYFQYRILTRALLLNIHVCKWDNNVSNLCTFCNGKKETTLHLLIECSLVSRLWKAIQKWCKYQYKINIVLSHENIILNNYRGPHAKLLNMYILITKFYIYRTRVQKTKPNFIDLLMEINKIKRIEKTIARMTNKQRVFNYKWVEY